MPRRQTSRSASTGSIGSADGDEASGRATGGRLGGGGRRGMGKRSSSSRPRTGAELSAQDIERVIRQSEAQLTVALEVGAAPGEADVASAIQAFCGAVGGETTRTITEEKQNGTVRIPLLECGVRDWKHLVALQRIVARQQRPVVSAQTTSSEGSAGEDLLAAEARVQHDARRRDTLHLAMLFAREAENRLWKFINDSRLRLQSAGITSRSLLPATQRLAVRLTPDIEFARSGSRKKPQPFDQAALHWTGRLEWRALVVSTEAQSRALSVATQRTVLALPRRSSELKYPELKHLVDTWISENRDPRLPIVVILRGIPGSGKSTLGREIQSLCNEMRVGCSIFSADFFFETPRGYVFDVKGLGKAHDTCKDSFSRAVLASLQRADSAAKTSRIVIVDNTNTQHWEYEPYQAIAAKYGCAVQVLEMKCPDAGTAFRMGQRNSHGVPPTKVVSMFLRWEHDTAAHSFTPQFDDAILSPNPVTDNSVGGKVVYAGLFLDASARAELLAAVPPAHKNITADHVTVFYKPNEQFMRTVTVGTVVMLRCVDVVQDASGQTVQVALLENPSGIQIHNKAPHITISTANGISSAYSNELLSSASANHVPIRPELILPATLGFAMIVQNQRVITTCSPFAFGDDFGCDLSKRNANPANHTATELGESSPVSRLCVVSVDEANLVSKTSDSQNSCRSRASGIHDGCLPFDKIGHHLAATCFARRVLLLKTDQSTACVPTTQMLQYVRQTLDPVGCNAVMFDEVIRSPASNKSGTLISLLQRDSFRELKELVVLTSQSPLDEVLPKNLDPAVFASVIAVTFGDESEHSSDSKRPPEDSFRPLNPGRALDLLGLNEQEHTRHQVLRACQKLKESADIVFGPNHVVVQRIDSTVLGLPGGCVDIGMVLKQRMSFRPTEVQRLVANLVKQLVKTGAHCVKSSDVSRFYIQMRSSNLQVPLFRVRLVQWDDSDAGETEGNGKRQMSLLENLRAQAPDVCADRSVYGALTALVRGILRSEDLSGVDGIQAPAFINIACEQLICVYLRTVVCTIEADAAKSGAILLELLRLVKFVEEWSAAVWMQNLEPVLRAFPTQNNNYRSVDAVVHAFKSVAQSFDGITVDPSAVSPNWTSEVLAVVAARLRRNLKTPTTKSSDDSTVRAYIELQDSLASGDTTLESLSVSDTLHDLAALDSVNPTRERFQCAVGCVGTRIDIAAASLELLVHIRDAFIDMQTRGNDEQISVDAFVLRDAETDLEI